MNPVKTIKNRLNVKKNVNIALAALLALAVGFLAYNLIAFYEKKQFDKTLRFGFITDVHCYSKFNKELGHWEVNWRCERPMQEFVRQMNDKFKPDFVIENGDLTDGRDRRGEEGFHIAKRYFDQIEAPKYHVLGNHETDNMSKDSWKDIVDYENTYYYFDIKKYRVIVLDANFVSEPTQNNEIIDMSPSTTHSYKGLMDPNEMEWLEMLLAESGDKKVLVFIHEPPLNQSVGRIKDDIFINPEPLRELFSKYGVIAVFSGHIEEFCYLEQDGVKYYVMQGFHKNNELLPEEDQYKDKGVFSEITIDDDIEVRAYYIKEVEKGEDESERKLVYDSFLINDQSVICNNESLMLQK